MKTNYSLPKILLLLFLLIFSSACDQSAKKEETRKLEVKMGQAEQTLDKFFDLLMKAKIDEASELLALESDREFKWPGTAPVESYEVLDHKVLTMEEAEIMEKTTAPMEGDVMFEVIQHYVGGGHHIYTYWFRKVQQDYKIIDYEAWMADGYQSKIELDTFVDQVERMVFKDQATEWYIESELTGFQVKDYLFTAKKGQKLEVKLNSDDPYTRFGLFLQRDKKSLNSLRMFKGKSEWSGKVPRDGDFRIRIYLKRKEAKKEHKAHYSVKVSII